jgi:hypothetical protein
MSSLADDAQISHVGGNIIPIKNNDISMEVERLRVKPSGLGWDVDVIYKFKNYGKQQVVKMGFPESWGQVNEIVGFKTWINGKEVKSEVLENQQQYSDDKERIDEYYEGYSRIEDEYLRFYSFEVPFKEAETIELRHKFSMGINCSPGEGENCWFEFILKTGSLWKGTIKDFDAVIEINRFITDDCVIYPENAVVQDYKISWRIKNFEPTKNLSVSIPASNLSFSAEGFAIYIMSKDDQYLSSNRRRELIDFYNELMEFVLTTQENWGNIQYRFETENQLVIADSLEKARRLLFGENGFGKYDEITYLKVLLSIKRACCGNDIMKLNHKELGDEILRFGKVVSVLNGDNPIEGYRKIFDNYNCSSLRDFLYLIRVYLRPNIINGQNVLRPIVNGLSQKLFREWYSGNDKTRYISAIVLSDIGYGNTSTAQIILENLKDPNNCQDILATVISRDREHFAKSISEKYDTGSVNEKRLIIKIIDIIPEPERGRILESARNDNRMKSFVYLQYVSDLYNDEGNDKFIKLLEKDMFYEDVNVRRKLAEIYNWNAYASHDATMVKGFDKLRYVKRYIELGKRAILGELDPAIRGLYIEGFLKLANQIKACHIVARDTTVNIKDFCNSLFKQKILDYIFDYLKKHKFTDTQLLYSAYELFRDYDDRCIDIENEIQKTFITKEISAANAFDYIFVKTNCPKNAIEIMVKMLSEERDIWLVRRIINKLVSCLRDDKDMINLIKEYMAEDHGVLAERLNEIIERIQK